MNVDEMAAVFEKHNDEFLKFDRIVNPVHRRPDLCAFLMLDAALPGPLEGHRDMVAAAEHDEIWLGVDVEALAAVATDELVRDLTRCGVRFEDDTDSLAMFV